MYVLILPINISSNTLHSPMPMFVVYSVISQNLECEREWPWEFFNGSVNTARKSWSCQNEAQTVKGTYLSKAFTCMKLFLYNKNCFFIKKTVTFGLIVVSTIYTSHIDHFTPQHIAFEQSAACLSVFLELLPGLIPLTMLWHAGWTLEKTNCMNMNYNYPTTIFRSIFAQILCISGIIKKISIWPWKIHKQKLKIYVFLPEICTFWVKILLHIVVG